MTRRTILFVNQHYWPDVASTGQHLTDLAEHLVTEGFDVSVLCSRGRYLAGSLEVPSKEVHNGVTIRRVSTTAFGRGTYVGRAIDYASFYVQSFFRGLFGPHRDLVIYLTTPSILSFVGRLVRLIRRQPYAVWSMDLHPEVEEALGVFKSGRPFTRLLHACARAGDRGAEFVVDLGAYMKQRLERRGVAHDRLVTIPVWSDRAEIAPVTPEANPLRDELRLQGRFVVMYSGNAGLAHRFEEVLEAMKTLKDHSTCFFLFVGGGPQRQRIIDFARQNEIENFRYLDYFPREQLTHSLTLGDVHLLTLREDMAGLVVPGKLYGIMAAGRPVIVIGPEESEPSQAVLGSDLGQVIDPNRSSQPAKDLVDALQTLERDPEGRAGAGQRARAVFLKRYEREVCCAAWQDIMRTHLSERGQEKKAETDRKKRDRRVAAL